MRDVMLIDAETVRKTGYVHKNVLPETIEVTIKRVQMVMLRKLMGVEAYNALLDAVSASLPPTVTIVPLTADQKDLIENYIQPYIVACVDFRILYPLTWQARSKAVSKGTDENNTPAEKQELTPLKDQMLKDVDAYAEELMMKLSETQNCEGSAIPLKTPHNSIKFR